MPEADLLGQQEEIGPTYPYGDREYEQIRTGETPVNKLFRALAIRGHLRYFEDKFPLSDEAIEEMRQHKLQSRRKMVSTTLGIPLGEVPENDYQALDGLYRQADQQRADNMAREAVRKVVGDLEPKEWQVINSLLGMTRERLAPAEIEAKLGLAPGEAENTYREVRKRAHTRRTGSQNVSSSDENKD